MILLEMRVWTNTTFMGINPIGTAAVVVAGSALLASKILNTTLEYHGLKGDVEAQDMIEVETDHCSIRILNDGNY